MYKTMYQKYQIDNGRLDCKYNYPIKYDFPKQKVYWKNECQSIPLNPWITPRYNDNVREDYTASVANITTGDKGGNSCVFFECPSKSANNFGSVNQMEPFYNIGPHTNLSDPPKFIYNMPNQNLIGSNNYCPQNLKQTPWYGSYNAQ